MTLHNSLSLLCNSRFWEFKISFIVECYSRQAGFHGVKRVDSLNDSPTFLDAAAEIVHTHLKGQDQTMQQLFPRCPSCVSEKCRAQKEFFRTMQGELATGASK